MNKRLILKHKICRRYEEDIWGIFFRKQKRRDYTLKKLNWLLFQSLNSELKHKFYRDRASINLVKKNMNTIRNTLFSKYLNFGKRKGKKKKFKDNSKFKVKNAHYLRTEYFLSFFFGVRLREFFFKKRFQRKSIINSINFQKYKKYHYTKKTYLRRKWTRNKRIYTIQDKLLRNKKINSGNFNLELIPRTNIKANNKVFKSLYHQRISKIWNFRKFYGCLSNKQLKKFCLMSYRKRGDIVINFLILLESRIDTILYRTGLVSSIFEARQFINHKKIMVNNEVVSIRSYLLKPSDILAIHPKYYNLIKLQLLKRIYNKSIMFYNMNYYETSYKLLNTLFIPKLLKVSEVPYNFELSDKDINSILYYYY